jgi:hypothetical protein
MFPRVRYIDFDWVYKTVPLVFHVPGPILTLCFSIFCFSTIWKANLIDKEMFLVHLVASYINFDKRNRLEVL